MRPEEKKNDKLRKKIPTEEKGKRIQK